MERERHSAAMWRRLVAVVSRTGKKKLRGERVEFHPLKRASPRNPGRNRRRRRRRRPGASAGVGVGVARAGATTAAPGQSKWACAAPAGEGGQGSVLIRSNT